MNRKGTDVVYKDVEGHVVVDGSVKQKGLICLNTMI